MWYQWYHVVLVGMIWCMLCPGLRCNFPLPRIRLARLWALEEAPRPQRVSQLGCLGAGARSQGDRPQDKKNIQTGKELATAGRGLWNLCTTSILNRSACPTPTVPALQSARAMDSMLSSVAKALNRLHSSFVNSAGSSLCSWPWSFSSLP